VHIPTFLQRNEGDPAIKVSNFPSLPPKLTHTFAAELFLKVERPPTSSRSNGASAGDWITS
jgi:hypothetical protein